MPPGRAIFADRLNWRHHERLGWQAFGDGRQLTGLDQFGQRWGFFVGARSAGGGGGGCGGGGRRGGCGGGGSIRWHGGGGATASSQNGAPCAQGGQTQKIAAVKLPRHQRPPSTSDFRSPTV